VQKPVKAKLHAVQKLLRPGFVPALFSGRRRRLFDLREAPLAT